jgi:hypothetical protein
LQHLVALQVYRVAGAIFLYLYLVPGTLTQGFALFAGIGDVLTGLAAIPVALMLKNKHPRSGLALVAWCVFGIADLIMAGIAAQLFGPGGLRDFPLNLIPLFIGPPFGIALHLWTLRAAWLQRNSLAFSKTSTQPTSLSFV